jgi:hypothetical protein
MVGPRGSPGVQHDANGIAGDLGGLLEHGEAVAAVGVDLDSVDLGLESGQLQSELLACLEVANQAAARLTIALAGHDDWDAGRVGHDHRGTDSSGELIDRDHVDRACHELLMRGRRCRRGCGSLLVDGLDPLGKRGAREAGGVRDWKAWRGLLEIG